MSYSADYARELEVEVERLRRENARLAKLAEVYRLSHHAQVQITKAAEARLEAADQIGCPPGCTSPFCDCPGTR